MRIGVIISDEPRINDEIRVSQVRLIGPNGEQVGVIATSVALNLAKEANLDLVEVAPNASSWFLTRWARAARSPESMRTPPSWGPATRTAVRTASSML